MIKYKTLLFRLIVGNAIVLAVVTICYIISKIRFTGFLLMVLSLAFLTFLQYRYYSSKIENGEKEEPNSLFGWERNKQEEELTEKKQSENTDIQGA